MAIDTNKDARTIDRSGGQTQSGPGAQGGPVTHHQTKVIIVAEDLHITPQQVTAASGPAADASKQAVGILSPYVQPEVKPGRRVPKPKPGAHAFVMDMAAVQEKFGPQLGHLNTNPTRMRERVAVAEAADEAVGPVTALGEQLTEISHISVNVSHKEAGAIYRRALVVADAFPDIAKAIAPYRDTYARVAKKGAVTRRHNKGKAAHPTGPVGVPMEPVPSTTTTVTTTQK